MKVSGKPLQKSIGGGSVASIGTDKDANVPTLLASLRKHKNFKQMLTYSLNCLDKIVKPPRLGWEVRSVQHTHNLFNSFLPFLPSLRGPPVDTWGGKQRHCSHPSLSFFLTPTPPC